MKLEYLADQLAQSSWYCEPDFEDDPGFLALSPEDKEAIRPMIQNCIG